MKKFLLILMVCCFAGIVDKSSATTAKATKVVYTTKANSKVNVAVKTKGKKVVVTKRALIPRLPAVCHNHFLTANQGFSTTYQWTDCGGTVRTQHIERGFSTTVCAQVGTVSGGPWTDLGTTCN
jgi:hypothetical protein